MNSEVIKHLNPDKMGINPLLKRDLKYVITVFVIVGLLSYSIPNMGTASLFWTTILIIFLNLKWSRAKSMIFNFERDHFLANEELVPYNSIVRIKKIENMMSVEVRKRFFTKTYIFHSPSESITDFFKMKFQPKPIPLNVSRILNISTYGIYLTAAMSFYFLGFYILGYTITLKVLIAFFMSAFLLILCSNTFCILNIRYVEHSDL